MLWYRITHVKWKTGFGTVALSVSNGSSISRNPEKKINMDRRSGAWCVTFFVGSN